MSLPSRNVTLGQQECWHLACHPSTGDYYVSTSYQAIYKVSRAGFSDGKIIDKVELFAGTERQSGVNDGHRLTQARFNIRSGFSCTVSLDGTIFICQPANNLVREIRGDTVRTLAGGKTLGYRDGDASCATFNKPLGVAYCEVKSKVFVADSGNGSIRTLRNGIVKTLSGNPDELVHQDGSFSSARFMLPIGIYIHNSEDPRDRRLLITDKQKSTEKRIIRMCEFKTRTVTTVFDLRSIECFCPTPSCDFMVNDYSSGNHPYRWHLVNGKSFRPTASTFISPSSDTSESLSLDFSDKDEENDNINPFTPSGRRSPSIGVPPRWNNFLQFGTTNSVHGEFAIVSSTLADLRKKEEIAIVISDISSLNATLTSSQKMQIDMMRSLKSVVGKIPTVEAENSALGQLFSLPSIVCDAWSIQRESIISAIQLSIIPQIEWQNFALDSLFSIPAYHFTSLASNLDNAEMIFWCYYFYTQLDIDRTGPLCAMDRMIKLIPKEDRTLLIARILSHDTLIEQDLIAILDPFLRVDKEEIIAKAVEQALQFKTPINELRPHEVKADEEPLQTIPIHLHLRFGPAAVPSYIENLGRKVKWKVPTSKRRRGMFRLSIEGHRQVLDVSETILYSQWSYFRRMIDSGLAESRERQCEFPSDMPPALLFSIVKALHSLFHVEHSELDAQYALAHGGQFGLVDIESGLPVEPFSFLIYTCQRQCLSR